MSRKTIFDAIRLTKGRIDTADVAVIDKALDAIGVPRDEAIPVDSPIPSEYFEILAGIESNHRPFVKASTSSASGLYQFIKSTWMAEGGAWGPDSSAAFGGLKPSEEEQTRRVRSFTMKNVAVLQKAGIAVNSATLYACHFLGPKTAVKILGAADVERADFLAGPAATNANPSILRGKNVSQFKTWLRQKTGTAP